MKMRSKAFVMAAAAGCACSAVMAGPDKRPTMYPVQRIQPVSIEYRGVVYPAHTVASDDNQLIYDNGSTATAGFSSGAVPHKALDDVSFNPGPGAGAGRLINGVLVGFVSVPSPVAPTAAVVVEVDLFNNMDTGATPINSGAAAGVRITFNAPAAGWPAAGGLFASAVVDLSGLPGGGIQVTDDSIGAEVGFYQAGTAPTPLDPDFTNAFYGGGVTVGSSADVYWRDANSSGAYDPTDARFFNGPPNLANFWLALQADVPVLSSGACCLADGTCAVMSQGACTNRLGVYGGDNSACGSCPQPFNEVADAGDTRATSANVAGSGALPGIVGNLGADDADMYKIRICDAANFAASTITWSSLDTQLFLFKADGTGVASDDDDPANSGAQSRLSSTLVAPLGNGTYYLAVSEYDKDPQSAGGAIWNDTPYTSERAPDGPGATGAVTGWDAGAGTGGAYTIAFHGACYVSGSSCYANCDGSTGAGFLNINDFVCFQSAFAAGGSYANCDGSTGAGNLNINDFVCFQSAFAAGCSAP